MENRAGMLHHGALDLEKKGHIIYVLQTLPDRFF
jgi:hypothetical protein